MYEGVCNMTGSNAHRPAQQEVLSTVKGKYRLTLFRPRTDANYRGRIVDETEFLGSFVSQNNIQWLRLSAATAVNPESGQQAQWGRILAYRGLVAPLVRAIVSSETGRFVTLNVDARMEVVKNGNYVNTVWTIYGFEYNNEYYTTKNGVLQVGPIMSSAEMANRVGQRDGDELFAQYERELGGSTVASSNKAPSNSRKAQSSTEHYEDQPNRSYVPREEFNSSDLDWPEVR